VPLAVPGGQVLQPLEPAPLYCPAGQVLQTLEPALLYWPAGQVLQPLEPSAPLYFPAGQVLQPLAPVGLNWPAGQLVHPPGPAYWPAAQRGRPARLTAASVGASSAVFQVMSFAMAKPEYSPQQPPALIPRAVWGAVLELESPEFTLTPLTKTVTVPLTGTEVQVHAQFVTGAMLVAGA